MKLLIHESYPGEINEPSAPDKLRKAVRKAEQQIFGRGGELEVVDELTDRLTEAYRKRVEALTREIAETYGRSDAAKSGR